MKKIVVLLIAASVIFILSCNRGPHPIKVSIVDPYLNKVTDSFVINSADLIKAKTDNSIVNDSLLNRIRSADSLVFQVKKRIDMLGSTGSDIMITAYGGKSHVKFLLNAWCDNDNNKDLVNRWNFEGFNDYDYDVTNTLNRQTKSAIEKQILLYPVEKVVITFTNSLTGETTDGDGFIKKVKELSTEKKEANK